MATVTVCDECEKPGRTPFQVTEKGGAVYDICSAPCMTAHIERMEQA